MSMHEPFDCEVDLSDNGIGITKRCERKAIIELDRLNEKPV